jgi:DNA-binding NtrC family response regulator
MSVWCSGSESFLQCLQALTPSAPLASATELGPADCVVAELEHAPLAAVREWVRQGCRVVIACEPAALPRALDAVRAGAHQVALLPLQAAELEQALRMNGPAEEESEASDVAAWRERFAPEIVGESPALFEALEVASRAADSDCPILITGENGTGKELLALALHRASRRARAPFVAVNCPAIPKELVESELFGHTKGAFTGATMARVGRFTAADKGTLFLDEIGEMDHAIQSKLLRVLQDYQVTRVGESRPHHVDVRVVAATNRDLDEMVAQGTFREDLYYRLNVLQIHLPPLRERCEDIPPLVAHFLETISAHRKQPAPTLGPEVMEALVAYHWPGNVRQLRNIVERLVILQRGAEVSLRHLPACVTCQRSNRAEASVAAPGGEEELFGAPLQLPAGGLDLREALQHFEDSMIRQALLQTGGNKNQAAKILGLNRTTLVEKLRKRGALAV